MNIEKTNEEILTAYYQKGIKGKGIVFDVLDSGVAQVGDLRPVNMTPEEVGDKADHGTKVAWLLHTACPEAEIRSYYCLTGQHIVNALKSVLAFVEAEPQLQHVVNISMVGSSQKETLEEVIGQLAARHVPVVVAAGNDGEQRLNRYPSCLQDPYTVSAITREGEQAGFTTWHDEVDFCEHGSAVLTRRADKAWIRQSGTSFASPVLAGKIGLLLCEAMARGHRMTDGELYAALKGAALDLGKGGRDPFFGWGYVQGLSPTQQEVGKEEKNMPSFDYVTDLGLEWPRGRVKRDQTDHIQIHHTVGNYATPARWKALHQRRIEEDGYKGIEYSFGVCPDGTIYDGRGLEYAHGAVKDSITDNANQRSVSITLIGDMREPDLPASAQYAAALRLCRDVLEVYGLSPQNVLGHNEVPVETGGTYPTACPCLDMDQFRKDLGEAQPQPEPSPAFPYYAIYGGSTYVNLRDAPSGNAIGRVSKGDRVVVLQTQEKDREWGEVILLKAIPLRGWCVTEWLEKEG